ncbi:MAG: hypothetical protein LBI69_00935 [Puniceicoccales bacterium]|jgi:hypothetical protein|nr:hypothetical protein [Puniceicoccales bacterium]
MDFFMDGSEEMLGNAMKFFKNSTNCPMPFDNSTLQRNAMENFRTAKSQRYVGESAGRRVLHGIGGPLAEKIATVFGPFRRKFAAASIPLPGHGFGAIFQGDRQESIRKFSEFFPGGNAAAFCELSETFSDDRRAMLPQECDGAFSNGQTERVRRQCGHTAKFL